MATNLRVPQHVNLNTNHPLETTTATPPNAFKADGAKGDDPERDWAVSADLRRAWDHNRRAFLGYALTAGEVGYLDDPKASILNGG
jgi:hypothetical protein